MSQPFLEKIQAEKDSFPRLDPDFARKQEQSQLGTLVRVRNRLGRPLTEEELNLIDSLT